MNLGLGVLEEKRQRGRKRRRREGLVEVGKTNLDLTEGIKMGGEKDKGAGKLDDMDDDQCDSSPPSSSSTEADNDHDTDSSSSSDDASASSDSNPDDEASSGDDDDDDFEEEEEVCLETLLSIFSPDTPTAAFSPLDTRKRKRHQLAREDILSSLLNIEADTIDDDERRPVIQVVEGEGEGEGKEESGEKCMDL